MTTSTTDWMDHAMRWLLRVIYCLFCALIGAQVALWEQHRADNYCQSRLAAVRAECVFPEKTMGGGQW